MRDDAVAFRGRKQVVEAYAANGMAPWGIVHGKELMFAHECLTIEDGEGMLTQTLERLHQGMSKAVFELRVYKLKKGEEILSNTPHARAFRFRLYSEEDPSPFDLARTVVNRQAQEEIDALKLQLKQLQDRLDQEELIEEEEDEPMTLNKMISGVIEMPGVKAALQDKLIGFIQSVVPMRNNNPRPAAVAGIEPAQPPQPGQVVLLPGQMEKIQQAINQLATKDPTLGDHLLGVARIATDSPDKYKWLVGML
jgi:hypothetical protein